MNTSTMDTNKSGLTSISEQPNHLRFNKYIINGYRPLCDIPSCFKSLLYMHNESVNIYTHGIGFIYFFSKIFTLTYQTTSSFLLFILFWQGSCFPFSFSFLYHLFMCHHSGKKTYNTLLQLDVFGIYWMTCFGMIPSIYTPLVYFPYLGNLVIAMHLSLSLYLLWGTLHTDSKVGRIVGLTVQYVYRIIFHFLRTFNWAGGDTSVIWRLCLAEVIFASGALVNAFNIPERVLQINGKLLYFINSHTLMHCASILGIYFSQKAVMMDIEWIDSNFPIDNTA